MTDPHQKNLVLSNFIVNEINLQPTEGEKIKMIISYLEDVHALLRKQDETIKSLIASNEITIDRLNSHSDHLKAHDQHLATHGEHLQTLSKD